jgi:hypothetical protein
MNLPLPYSKIMAVDAEFGAGPGGRPEPRCVVFRDLVSGRLDRRWLDGGAPGRPPFRADADTLFIAYYASAELGCFLARGWPLPVRILDLCAEFKCHTAGLSLPGGKGLIGALTYHGLDAITAAEKKGMQQLALRGGPYAPQERRDLLDYCQSDVDSLARLLPAMLPKIDLPRALLRGRYMAAAARMEWNGVPIDVKTLAALLENWDLIKGGLIARVDKDYGVYEGRTFKACRFEEYLWGQGISWPCLDSGALALDDDTFREMAKIHPAEIGPIRELRHTLSQLRLNALAVGPDGRNRCLLGAFGTKTGRNAPSNAKFAFGPSAWLRNLILPDPGWFVAYVDWSAQEYGIAAYLSGDPAMQDAYLSRDPYLWLAKRCGAAPEWATKKTHGAVRDRFKILSLGILYGLSAEGLARKLGVPPCEGRHLLGQHRRTFRRFWEWSDLVEMEGVLTGRLWTVFGWTLHAHGDVNGDVNVRSLRNFPMQGNGAEMLRLACCLATERGIRVCAPVHDALLVEGPIDDQDAIIDATRRAMREASEVVLPGFPLRTDVKVFRRPERYRDERGERVWQMVCQLLEECRTLKIGAG